MSPETGVSYTVYPRLLFRFCEKYEQNVVTFYVYPKKNRRFKRIKLIKIWMHFERQSRKKQKPTSLMESVEGTWNEMGTVKPLLDAITTPKRPKISFYTGLSLFNQHLPDNMLSTTKAWKLYLLFVRFGEVVVLEGLIVSINQ